MTRGRRQGRVAKRWTAAFGLGFATALLGFLPVAASAVDLVVTEDTTLDFVGTYSYDDVVIQAGVTLTLASDTEAGLGSTLNCANLTVEAGGVLSADGQGYGAGAGPGAGAVGAYRAGAAGGAQAGNGAGGTGNNGSTGASSGYTAFDSIVLGSGGGNGSGPAGGAGGGGLTINVSGVATIDGLVSANGKNGAGSSTNYASGGGGGGTIVLVAGSVVGSGTIRANGGSGGSASYAKGGGGGGGQVRVGGLSAGGPDVQALGGGGTNPGGAGFELTTAPGSSQPSITVDNGGATSGAASVVPAGSYAFADASILGGADIRLSSGVTVVLSGDLLVDASEALASNPVTAANELWSNVVDQPRFRRRRPPLLPQSPRP